jgi:diguanylate cyclase (GGDEF)-like protein
MKKKKKKEKRKVKKKTSKKEKERGREKKSISLLGKISKDFKKEIKKEKPRSEILDKLFKELYLFATKDHLTGVFNRHALNELLGREMERVLRHNLPLTVMMLDIDDFKKYNDTFGHLQGDEALRKATKIIMQNSRKEDFVARYGGEEFIIVLPGTNIKKAIEAAERIRVAINNMKIKKVSRDIEEGYERITVSMGIAQLTKKGIQEMIHRADMALYKAKIEGKNKICVSKINGKKRK